VVRLKFFSGRLLVLTILLASMLINTACKEEETLETNPCDSVLRWQCFGKKKGTMDCDDAIALHDQSVSGGKRAGSLSNNEYVARKRCEALEGEFNRFAKGIGFSGYEDLLQKTGGDSEKLKEAIDARFDR
jgi:hypothetical protein